MFTGSDRWNAIDSVDQQNEEDSYKVI